MKYASVFQTVTNLVVIGVAVFVVVRPGGPVRVWVSDWRAQIRRRRYIEERWRDISRGPSINMESGTDTLVEFSDYQCPFCRNQHHHLSTMLAQHNNLTIIYRHLPLPIHPAAQGAALAAICAQQQGRFSEMHNLLFSDTTWQRDRDWQRLAVAAGLPDLSEFNDCLTSAGAVDALSADQAVAADLDLRVTPSWVFHGGVRAGVLSTEQLDSVIGLTR